MGMTCFNICYSIGASALQAAIAAVSKYGGASAGFRTLLDALIPASKVLQEVNWLCYVLSLNPHMGSFCAELMIYTYMQRLNAGDDPVNAFVLSSEAALSGAKSTKHMHAQVVFSYGLIVVLYVRLYLCFLM